MKYRRDESEISFSNLEFISFNMFVCINPICKYFLISSLNVSSTLVLFLTPFGLPRILPLARAAANPCFVLSEIISLSVCAKYP